MQIPAKIMMGSLSLIAATMLCTGCSSINGPAVNVANGSVTDRSDEAVAVAFDLQLENPNTQPLALLELHYTMNIDGRTVYQGRRDAQSTLPASGHWTLHMPAVIPFNDVDWSAGTVPAEVRYRLTGTLSYVSPGPLPELFLETGIYQPQVHFADEGTLTLSQ